MIKQACIFLVGLALFSSCAGGDRATGKEVRKETREKRRGAILLTAKEGNAVFNLREKNFFDYYELALGVAKTELYAGTYERKGDSLFLGFQNNYQPGDLTSKGYIDGAHKQLILFSKDTGRNRRLTILAGN